MAEKMNDIENKATFDKETDVNLSVEQLSYICKYCGKVNSISAPNCIRCGKRRPRNEYLDAMKRLEKSKDVRQEFINEQIKAEAELKDARQQQFVRIVESRVEDEKARIMAQQEIRLEQDREDIKRATARDAVLRIIAAENAAEEKVAAAEARADAAVSGKSKEIDDLIAAEREKALNAAAEKLIAERAAIEEVAKERIDANRKANEYDSAKQIAEAKDEAEKTAARQAVLQIIAAEKAAEDQIRITRDAFQQAATERIIEERILADKEAAARYAAEKQAIERAAEERIRAEREAVKKILDERGMAGYAQSVYGAQQVQPFAIVPYLNQNQPVYQYNPNRVVYKFVPDAPAAAGVSCVKPIRYDDKAVAAADGKKAKKEEKGKEPKEKKVATSSGKARVCGLLTLILSAAIIVFAAVLNIFVKDFAYLDITDGKFLTGNNFSVLLACGAFCIDGINAIFKSSIALPSVLAESEFYGSAGAAGSPVIALVPVAFVIFTLIAVILFIRSIVRLIGGKGKSNDWVAGLVMIITSVIVAATELLVAIFAGGYGAVDALKTVFLTNYGNIAFIAMSVIITIISAVGGNNKKEI